MSFPNDQLPSVRHEQLQDALSKAMARPVKWESLTKHDRWLWAVLGYVDDEQERYFEHHKAPFVDAPEPALLLGLLIKQRNKSDNVFSDLLVEAEAGLLRWIRQHLTDVNTDQYRADCLMMFQYLISSQRANDTLTDLLTALRQYYPLTTWDPGIDLTLESGATGWLLMLIKARKSLADNQRIASTVSHIEPYLAQYIDYLHRHQIPIDELIGSELLFPTSVKQRDWQLAEQQSWRQGDLGHLLLLYEAEPLLGQPQLTDWADRLGGYLIFLRQTGRLNPTSAGLITGTAGLSLLYRRLHQLTGQQSYLSEGMYWLNETLQNLPLVDDTFRTGRLGIVCALNHWMGHEVGLDLLHL